MAERDEDKKTQGEAGEDRERGQEGWGLGFMEGVLPDLVKKLFVAGIGAVAMTEEGIRRLANEFSLPKDVVAFLLTQVQNTKNELFRVVAREIRDFLENANLGAELQRILTSLTFEVKMEIRLKPSENSNGVRPSVSGSLTVKGQDS